MLWRDFQVDIEFTSKKLSQLSLSNNFLFFFFTSVCALKRAIKAVSEEIQFTIEPKLAQITHILFDMDGLLLDTESIYSIGKQHFRYLCTYFMISIQMTTFINYLHIIAQQKQLDPFGITFTYEVKSMMMGKKSLEAIEIMLKHYKLDVDPVQFHKASTIN